MVELGNRAGLPSRRTTLQHDDVWELAGLGLLAFVVILIVALGLPDFSTIADAEVPFGELPSP